jgi:sugar phosphate isomerase/epimerase
VAKAAHILAAAGETAKKPSFSAYARLFELAEDYDRDLAVALAKRPRNRTEIAECRERLARTLKDLLPYEKPRLTTTKVQGDKDAPLFDLSGLSDQELHFLRRTVLKAQPVG